MGIETKKCKDCERTYEKTEENFYYTNREKGYFSSYCRDCEKMRSKERWERRKRDPRHRERDRIRARKYKKRNMEARKKNPKPIKESKTCTTCDIEYQGIEEFFHIDNSTVDGFASRCKNCKQEYNKTQRERRSKYYKKYHEENPTYRKKYYMSNKGYFRIKGHERKAKISQLPYDLVESDWLECLKYFDNKCAYCGESSDILEQDHVIPVSMGGGYTVKNIIPACLPCNRSKHSEDMMEWYITRKYFSEKRLKKINSYVVSGDK